MTNQVQNNSSLFLGTTKAVALGAGSAFAGYKCLHSPQFCKVATDGFLKSAELAKKLGAEKCANKLLGIAGTFGNKLKQFNISADSFIGNLKNNKIFSKLKLEKLFSTNFGKKISELLTKTKLNTPTGKVVLMGAGLAVAAYLCYKAISSLFLPKTVYLK